MTETGYPSQDKPWRQYYSAEALTAALPACTVWENLYARNRGHESETALIYFGKKITYGELFDGIDRAAAAFRALGVKAGEIVSLCLANTPEMVYCFYGLNKIGAAADFLDVRLSGPELREALREQGSRFAVVLDSCYETLREVIRETAVIRAVVMTPFHSLPFPLCLRGRKRLEAPFVAYETFLRRGKGQDSRPAVRRPEELAVIAHTGGTTGVPKGVRISNRSLVCVAEEYLRSGMPMGREEKFLCLVPPFILNGLCTCLNLPLSAGAAVILVPRFEQEQFPHYLKARPEHVVAAPSWWERLRCDERMAGADLSFLVTAASGGDGMSRESEEKMNAFLRACGARWPILNGYGMTETGSSVCTNMQRCGQAGSIGIPLPWVTAGVFDEAGRELPYDTRGELWVKGPSIMDGYCGRAAGESEHVLRVGPDGDRWVRTGDLAHISREGFVFIDGRIKRVIIREGGFKVFPGLVEDVLQQIPGIEGCAVVGRSVGAGLTGQVPVAFVVCRETGAVQAEDCLRRCREALASHCVPEEIFFLPQLPLTPVGKVDHRALERMAETSQGSRSEKGETAADGK